MTHQGSHQSVTAALAAFHLEVGTIEKTARAQYGAFADLSTVLSVVTPVLAKHGLTLVQTFDTEGDADILVTTLYHTSNQNIFSRARLPRSEGSGGRQNPLHQWGGSVTYARRFCALAMLGLAAGMEDDDGDHADVRTSVQATRAPAKRTRKTKPKEPVELDAFDTAVGAHDALNTCTTPAELAAWVARLKASQLEEPDVNELRASYAEHVAQLEEAAS